MKIESKIAAPVKPSKILNQMEIGDSIFDEGASISSSKIYMVARQMPKRNGKKFTAASEGSGIRIWRIE